MARRLGTPSSRRWSGGHLEIKERINIALKSTLHRLSVQKLLSSPSQVFQRNERMGPTTPVKRFFVRWTEYTVADAARLRRGSVPPGPHHI